MSDDELTHIDGEGRARMVDVSAKPATARTAVAEGRIVMSEGALERLVEGGGEKGDPLQVARLAGIMAGKRTADLIPLCHQLPGASVSVTFETRREERAVLARAEASYAGRTGVEMEALTAVSVALLTVYDMLKAVDRGMRIEGIRLLAKDGGASGEWRAGDDDGSDAGPAGPRSGSG